MAYKPQHAYQVRWHLLSDPDTHNKSSVLCVDGTTEIADIPRLVAEALGPSDTPVVIVVESFYEVM